MQCPSCECCLDPALVSGEVVERCERCGGEFCTYEALRAILARHLAPDGSRGARYRAPSPLSDPVRYRKCPACSELMMRHNFRDSSGVVVDVCAAHGVWFDQGELATIVEFAATGALAKADERASERALARKELDAWGADLRAVGPRHYVGGLRGMSPPLDSLADIARFVPGFDRDKK